MDLKENELQLLATHLGHDVKTHKEYYRLSDSTMELTKVCSVTIVEDYFDILAWLTFVVIRPIPNVDAILSVDSAY